MMNAMRFKTPALLLMAVTALKVHACGPYFPVSYFPHDYGFGLAGFSPLMVATNAKFTKGQKKVNVKDVKVTKKNVTGLTAGQKSYVKIRAYKTVDGKKYYSAWSTAKSATTN